MANSYNDTLKGHAIDRANKHRLYYDDLSTTALHSSELFGDIESNSTAYLKATGNLPKSVAARTDADDANVNPSVNSLRADAKQDNKAVKSSTSLPIGMAQELTPDLFSTNNATFSGKSHNSTALLSADRPIATQSIRATSALVFPPDQRVPVTQPSYPFNAVGRMTSRWKGADGILNTGDDIVISSSGAMVGRFHFLTAGHSLYQQKFGGWAAQVEVRLPEGGIAFSTNLRTYGNWTRNRDFKYDLGLVTLDRNLGSQTGWFGYGYNNAIRAGTTFNSTGYPSDKADTNGDGVRDNFNVWTQVGKITQTTDLTLRSTDLDLAPGSSGGPLWLQTKSGPTIYGVTSNKLGSLYGEFTRITRERFTDIRRWIQADTAQRPLYAAASRNNSSRGNVTTASARVAVGQFEDDILTGGAEASGHFLTNRPSTKTAAQPVHRMAQAMSSTVEADYLRSTIAPSHAGNSEPLWNSNHPLTLAVQTQTMF